MPYGITVTCHPAEPASPALTAAVTDKVKQSVAPVRSFVSTIFYELTDLSAGVFVCTWITIARSPGIEN